MDIQVKKFRGRDPEKDCSHRMVKTRIAGGLDMPRKEHLPGFTGRVKGKITDGKYKTFEQVHDKGVTKWVETSQ